MDKNLNHNTEKVLDDELREEAHFTPESFTEEVSLILNDFFRGGEFMFDGNVVNCKFENGQKFILKAEEV